MKKIFKSEKDFQGYYNAETWIKNQGLYLGSMQRDDPIGILNADWIQSYKWRYLTREDKINLDGIICSGNKREDITVVIFDDEDKRESYV